MFVFVPIFESAQSPSFFCTLTSHARSLLLRTFALPPHLPSLCSKFTSALASATLLLAVLMALSAPAPAAAVVTVPTLNVTQYLGLWFQMYQDPFDSVTGEYDGYCATATYGLNANGTISVLNKDRFGSITGKVVAVNGWCYQADPTQPGQLTLYFPGVAPGPAPYWIVQRTYPSPTRTCLGSI